MGCCRSVGCSKARDLSDRPGCLLAWHTATHVVVVQAKMSQVSQVPQFLSDGPRQSIVMQNEHLRSRRETAELGGIAPVRSLEARPRYSRYFRSSGPGSSQSERSPLGSLSNSSRAMTYPSSLHVTPCQLHGVIVPSHPVFRRQPSPLALSYRATKASRSACIRSGILSRTSPALQIPAMMMEERQVSETWR